jgi:hypothetical protein
VLSTVGVSQAELPGLVEQKLNVTQKIIDRQISKGDFPILGYSYYEYAKSLKQSDSYSALMYVEDALELSNIDMYFQEKKRINFIEIDTTYVWVFLLGLSIGLALPLFFFLRFKIAKVKNPRKTLAKRISLGKKR